MVVVWPVTGLAGGAVPSRAPGKCGDSTQGPSLWSRGGAGNSVRSHGGWAACGGGATRDWEAAGRGRGSPRGSRPRHLLPGWIPVGERLLMSAQAPLTVGQRSRCKEKVTKALRSPTEVPAWDARRSTKRRARTPRRPPSLLTRAKKEKPWAVAWGTHLESLAAAPTAAAWPGVATPRGTSRFGKIPRNVM